ncbi:MAG: SUMF1/EgtB/PvdO family nonheme iron enzyme [Candidatus Latescibacterota bacterium]
MKRWDRFSALLVIALLVVSTSASSIIIQGAVADTAGKPVSGALVTFTDESNPDNKFRDYTDTQGKYAIDLSMAVGFDTTVPSEFSLGQNYPNPFNPTTTIPFTLDSPELVSIAVYNIIGQKVATVIDNYMSAGFHFVTWNGMDDRGNHVSAGIYLYQLKAGRQIETKKMLLLDGGGSHAAKPSMNSGNQSVAKSANQVTYTITIVNNVIIPYTRTGVTITYGQTMDFVVTLIDSIIIINGITFVSIPGNTFEMGDVENAGTSEERPVHSVTLTGFEMSIYEITNAQYAQFLNDAKASGDITATSSSVEGAKGAYSKQKYIYLAGTLSGFPGARCWITYNNETFSVVSGHENWPVVWLTWYGSKAFALYYGLDLPSEAEWEYACRGGKQYLYGTDDGTFSTSKANHWNTGIYHPVEVGSYPKNPFGLYDMSGNVWEWCGDWYDSYSSSPAINPTGAETGSNRVGRGGRWYDNSWYCRSAYRVGINPSNWDFSFGFRVVRR